MRRHFLAASFCAADRLVSATHDGQRERSAENNIYAIKCLMRQPQFFRMELFLPGSGETVDMRSGKEADMVLKQRGLIRLSR